MLCAERKADRPDIEETFCDDVEIDPRRLHRWDLGPFESWSQRKRLAEGNFGSVYKINDMFMSIQIGAELFRSMVIKVAKTDGTDEAQRELYGEATKLGMLTRNRECPDNIVKVLGIVQGAPDEPTAWSMALEFCETDLEKVVLPEKKKSEARHYSKPFVIEQAKGIAWGMSYCHDRETLHLDLKPENILLKRNGGTDEAPTFTPKIADLGMTSCDQPEHTSGRNRAQPMAGSDQLVETGKSHRWTGTYLYMAPEATGVNAQKDYKCGRIVTSVTQSQWRKKVLAVGRLAAPVHRAQVKAEAVAAQVDVEEAAPVEQPPSSCFGATDVFSFGVMLWVMFARTVRWYEGRELPEVWVSASGSEDRSVKRGSEPSVDGGWKEDMRGVAVWYFAGQRPGFDEAFPPLLKLLIQACWEQQQEDRLTFLEIHRLLSGIDTDKWLEPAQAQDAKLEPGDAKRQLLEMI
eukprot:COSAG04_NODE_559_length_12608_cov_12.306499_12_plen_462_part_00